MTHEKPPLRVLFVEDNMDDVILIVNWLRGDWHVIWHRVENEAGLLLSLDEAWDVVLCDVSLPQFSAERALVVTREYFALKNTSIPPFIVISGTVDEKEGVLLMQKGARDFITKDSMQRLPLTIKREQRQSGELLAKDLEMEEAYDSVIAAWGTALEARDNHTYGHTVRVTTCALRLAIELHVDRKQFVDLNRGSLLHDIGKIRIPDAILFKQEGLTNEEWAIMRQHPVYGYEMLRNIPFLRGAAVVPLFHHERWNGTGYPEGRMGESIPFLARLFSVCDVYDALTSERPYRPSWDKSKAVAYLLEEAGKTFDPKIVETYINMIGRG